ncbi:acyl-CoA dehydrogenase family protein [alpha proteobacterium U9-1i]|nr:acyl-CoA dehydrogenase family protein [alpha proteobacterium U9-1i]
MAILSEEQVMLKDAASAWARDRSPIAAYRKLRNSGALQGYDSALFAEIAEMGWAGIVAPEEHGGADFGFMSMGVVLEQLGRTLTPSPLVNSSLAAVIGLRRAGSAAQQQHWLPKIAAGEAVVTIAVDEGAQHNPLAVALKAEKSRGNWLLNGEKRPVLHGMGASAVLVAARTSGAAGDVEGLTLFIVPTNAPKLSKASLAEVEQRGAAIYTFNGVELGADAIVGEVGKAASVLDHMLDCARAGLAAEMLGSASAAFDITLAYLKTRLQFGQLIGSFQALQHRAAALYGELELTRSAVEAALEALDAQSPQARELVSLAKALAGDTFKRVSGEMIQLHGGIGMTDEHDAGLFYKRARVADMSYGSAAYHRERYAALTGY